MPARGFRVLCRDACAGGGTFGGAPASACVIVRGQKHLNPFAAVVGRALLAVLLCALVLASVSCSNAEKAAYDARFAAAGDAVDKALGELEGIVANPETDVDACALALESFGELARRQALRERDPSAYARATDRLIGAMDGAPAVLSSEPERKNQPASPREVGYLQGVATVALGSLADPAHDSLLVAAATSTEFREPAAFRQRAGLGQVVLRLEGLRSRRSVRSPLLRGLGPMLAASARGGALDASAAADLTRYVVHLESELADPTAVAEMLEDQVQEHRSGANDARSQEQGVAAIRLHHRVLARQLRRGGFDARNAPRLEALRALALGPSEPVALAARASAAGLAPLALVEWMVAGLEDAPSEANAGARRAMSDHLMATWERVLRREPLPSSAATSAGVVYTAQAAYLDPSETWRNAAAREALAERVAEAVRASLAGLDARDEGVSTRLGFLARVAPEHHVRWLREEAGKPSVRDEDSNAARVVADQAVSILALEGALDDSDRLAARLALASLGAHRNAQVREDVLATVAGAAFSAAHETAEATLLDAIDRRPTERDELTVAFVRFVSLAKGDASLSTTHRGRLLTLALDGSGESAAVAYAALWRDDPHATYAELVQRLTAAADGAASRPSPQNVSWASEGLLRGGHAADQATRSSARAWLAGRFAAADEDTRLLILRALLESGGVGAWGSQEAFATALAENPLLQKMLDGSPGETP